MSNVPRLFISYSWSTPEHEQWVIDLAEQLVESGVDVVLDKWSLREGHDAIAFMEQMVTDPSIAKVVLVCDPVYAAKADGRAGGVGTEAQIISSEVYAKRDQDKFVAVIAEKSAEGKICVPAYYRSRIYIDLSESERYAENFEKLVRWIFNKPLYIRPELGKPPAYISDEKGPTTGTSALARRALDGLRGDKGYARGALDEYLTTFAQHLERFRLPTQADDDAIVRSIESFVPARDEVVQVFICMAQYGNAMELAPRLHRFYEDLLPYMDRPEHVTSWCETDFDNFKFIVHEIFLYGLAVLIRADQLDAAEYLLRQRYYINSPNKGNAVSFIEFRDYMKSMEIRKNRTSSNRISLRADLLEQRSRSSGVEFRHLMEADFVCFLRADLLNSGAYGWWPETLLYTYKQYGPFEIFARASSKAYLPRVLKLVGAQDLATFKSRIRAHVDDRQSLPHWDYRRLDTLKLSGAEALGSLS